MMRAQLDDIHERREPVESRMQAPWCPEIF